VGPSNTSNEAEPRVDSVDDLSPLLDPSVESFLDSAEAASPDPEMLQNIYDTAAEFEVLQAKAAKSGHFDIRLDRLERLAALMEDRGLMTPSRWTPFLSLALTWTHEQLRNRRLRRHPFDPVAIDDRLHKVFLKWSHSSLGDHDTPSDINVLLKCRYQLFREELGHEKNIDLATVGKSALIVSNVYTDQPEEREMMFHSLVRGLLKTLVSSKLLPDNWWNRLVLALQIRRYALSRRKGHQATRNTVENDVHIGRLIIRCLRMYTDIWDFMRNPIPASDLRSAVLDIAETSPENISYNLFFVATRSQDYELARVIYRFMRIRETEPDPPPADISSPPSEPSVSAAAVNNIFMASAQDEDVITVNDGEDESPAKDRELPQTPGFVWQQEHEHQLRHLFNYFKFRDPKFALSIYSHWTIESGLQWPVDMWTMLVQTVSVRCDIQLLEHILARFEQQQSEYDPSIRSHLPTKDQLVSTAMNGFAYTGRLVPTLRVMRVLERYVRPSTLPLEDYHVMLTLIALATTDRAPLAMRIFELMPHVPTTTTYNLLLMAVVSRWRELDEESLAHVWKLWTEMVDTCRLRPDGQTYSAVIFGMVRLGELDMATRMWNLALGQGLGGDVKKDVLAIFAHALDREGRKAEAEAVYLWAWSPPPPLPSEQEESQSSPLLSREEPPHLLLPQQQLKTSEKNEPRREMIVEAFRRQWMEEEGESEEESRVRVRRYIVGKRLPDAERRGDEPALVRVAEIVQELQEGGAMESPVFGGEAKAGAIVGRIRRRLSLDG
jgi:hypothetical protein